MRSRARWHADEDEEDEEKSNRSPARLATSATAEIYASPTKSPPLLSFDNLNAQRMSASGVGHMSCSYFQCRLLRGVSYLLHTLHRCRGTICAPLPAHDDSDGLPYHRR